MREEQLLESRIMDLCRRCDDGCYSVFSNFLTGEQMAQAVNIVKKYGGLEYRMAGGFLQSDRAMLCIYPPYLDFQRDVAGDCPIQLLHIQLKGAEIPCHRDYLGAILGLGLKREKIGDIMVSQNSAYVAVHQEIAEFICQQLSSVGRSTVESITPAEAEQVDAVQQYEEIRDTIPSPRLDGVVASLLRTSRGKAQQVVSQKLVSINHMVKTEQDTPVEAGDLLSIRGYGKFSIDDMSKVTKKGRLVLLARKFK